MLHAAAPTAAATAAEQDMVARQKAATEMLLKTLKRETGTILETHGVRLYEERYRAVGPLGVFGDGECYPESVRPTPNAARYPAGSEPAQNFFDLESPPELEGEPPPERLPPPVPLDPDGDKGG